MLRAIAFTFIGFFLMSCDIGKLDFFSSFNQSDADIFHPQPIDDFTLLDHAGASHQLTYYDDANAIVIMVHGNGCPIVRNGLADFKALQNTFKSKNIRFFMLNSNLHDTRENIAKEAKEWGITIPILVDDDQLIGESLELSRTAEIRILDPKKMKISYRGPSSARLGYEVQKNKAIEAYAESALNNFLENKKIKTVTHSLKGCLINFPRKQPNIHPEISYTETIAPLLNKKCQGCHNDTGIGPWSMSSYSMIKGFAPMIREVVRLKRMPPWDADPKIGLWEHDRSLSVLERQNLVHWIESGAPRGGGIDPLIASHDQFSRDWVHGEPDVTINLPAYQLPASGILDYKFPILDNPLTEDVWLAGLDVLPGDPKGLHHTFIGSAHKEIFNNASFSQNELASFNSKSNLLAYWAPGNEDAMYPNGTGVLLKPGEKIIPELHYTTYGRSSVDRTQLALYFHEEPPKKILRFGQIFDFTLRIPAHVRSHKEQAYNYIEKDMHIYMFAAHAHYRGKSAKFTLEYPSGQKEVLLSVPNYDADWQLGYKLKQPKFVPAGSRLIFEVIYDNSIHNLKNPDPTRDVPWGVQISEEMLVGIFLFSWDDEKPDNITHNAERMQQTVWMGSLDQNMDGMLAREEVPKSFRRTFYRAFHLGDKDKNDMLDYQELMSTIK